MLQQHITFQLRYVGQRFEGARLPLDVLQDLPAFRDLIVAYAKDLWRLDHADRKRLPKGFDKSISFDLIAIEAGSAMPKIDWDRQEAQASLPGFADQLEEVVQQSFTDIVSLVDEAGHQRYPTALSSEHIRALNKLGASLRDSERIEFVGSEGKDGNVVYLDTHRRKSLITHVRETYTTRFEGTGILKGLHLDGYISVETELYGELKIRVDAERISLEFDGNTGGLVQFALLLQLDNHDKLHSIDEVYEVDLVEQEAVMRCNERLSELRKLATGWLHGDGDAPSAAALSSADVLLRKRPALAERYRIYPTPTGGVLFEFQTDGWDYSVEIGAEGTVEFFGVEMGGAGELEAQVFRDVGDAFLSAYDARLAGRGGNA